MSNSSEMPSRRQVLAAASVGLVGLAGCGGLGGGGSGEQPNGSANNSTDGQNASNVDNGTVTDPNASSGSFVSPENRSPIESHPEGFAPDGVESFDTVVSQFADQFPTGDFTYEYHETLMASEGDVLREESIDFAVDSTNETASSSVVNGTGVTLSSSSLDGTNLTGDGGTRSVDSYLDGVFEVSTELFTAVVPLIEAFEYEPAGQGEGYAYYEPTGVTTEENLNIDSVSAVRGMGLEVAIDGDAVVGFEFTVEGDNGVVVTYGLDRASEA